MITLLDVDVCCLAVLSNIYSNPTFLPIVDDQMRMRSIVLPSLVAKKIWYDNFLISLRTLEASPTHRLNNLHVLQSTRFVGLKF